MAKHEGREKTEGGAYVVSKQIQVVSRHKAESQKGRKHLSKKGRDTAKLGPNHKKPGDTYSPSLLGGEQWPGELETVEEMELFSESLEH